MEQPPLSLPERFMMIAFPTAALLGVGIVLLRGKPKNFIRLPENVCVHIVETEQACDAAVSFIESSGEKILGFDLEWGHGGGKKEHPVALVQLAAANDVWLIRLNVIDKMPASLARILESRTILKAGVAILGDARRLLSDWSAMTFGCVELQSIAARYNLHSNGTSLSSLCLTVLGARLDKSHHITCSNWELRTLSERQIAYAALDAWVGREILVRVYNTQCALLSTPSSPTAALPVTLPPIEMWCEEYADARPVRPRIPKLPGAAQPKQTPEPLPDVSTRKSALYENCRMLHPDGTLMCTCDKKKVQWYLSRNLAELVSDNPPTIRLKFTPTGHGKSTDPYYLSKKENICVVCGAIENLHRHSIVPHAYRAWFPDDIKSRSSHDIVLVCTRCMSKCMDADARKKEVLSRFYNAPLDGSQPKFAVSAAITAVRSAARTLVRSTDLPEARRVQLEAALRTFLKQPPDYVLTKADLEKCAALDPKAPTTGYRSHGELVAAQLNTPALLTAFIKDWRRHFVETMQPRHLPQFWSVDHDVNQ